MDFWTAYSDLRSRCQRPEEMAVGVEVSVHTIASWDRTAEGSEDTAHSRNPSYFNRIRLARFAEAKGAPKKVVAALKPEPGAEART